MSTRDVVQRTVDLFGKSAGMQKHSGAWYASTPETWAVVQLQKSDFAQRYYLNVGFWIKAASDVPYPPERNFHVRTRLDALLPDLGSEIERLLDLRVEMADDDRAERLSALLQQRLLPYVRRGATLTGLRDMYRDGSLSDALVRGEALTVLNTSMA